MSGCVDSDKQLKTILLNHSWDIHRKDIETVSYGYTFKKDNVVEYYVYDRIEKRRDIFPDEDNIIENSYRLIDGDSIIVREKKKRIVFFNSDTVILKSSEDFCEAWVRNELPYIEKRRPMDVDSLIKLKIK